jgi:hypothetical protein
MISQIIRANEPLQHPIYDMTDLIRQLGSLRSYIKCLYGPVREYHLTKFKRLILKHVPCHSNSHEERVRASEAGASFLLREKIGRCGLIRFSRRILIPEAYILARESHPELHSINYIFVYNFLAGATEFHRLILCLLELDEAERTSLFSRACYSHSFDVLDRYLGNKAWRILNENVRHLPRPLCQTILHT